MSGATVSTVIIGAVSVLGSLAVRSGSRGLRRAPVPPQFLEGRPERQIRSCQTMPPTAPRIITTPMAISQDMSAKTTPIGPYFLSSEVTTPEKTTEKTASMPSQNTAVGRRPGDRSRQEIRPASRNQIVTHQ